jgi:aspartate kinase
MRKTLVMKFGGASIASTNDFKSIAELVSNRAKEYPRIVVVVSAMGDTTDQLITLAKEVHPSPPEREYDMLLSVGERISMSLLAMALTLKNCNACSFTGSQSGIITCGQHCNARIIDVQPRRILPCLEMGKIAVVAGFQGVSKSGEITTLGRGGSDTSAVALAIALNAEKVEFFKDVPGIFSEDPKSNPQAHFLKKLTYEKAIEIANNGSGVLHPRCIALAQSNQLPLHVLSFNQSALEKEGSWIGSAKKPVHQPPLFESL